MIIFKYPLKREILQYVDMHRPARFLDLQMQDGVPTLWVMHDTPLSEDKERRSIAMVGTGQQVLRNAPGTYLGSVQEGPFVWHYFDAS